MHFIKLGYFLSMIFCRVSNFHYNLYELSSYSADLIQPDKRSKIEILTLVLWNWVKLNQKVIKQKLLTI